MATSKSGSVDSQKSPDVSGLTPTTFLDFIGQERIKSNLKLSIEAAKQRNEPLGHVLLVGPPDFGKATLAKIICNTIGGKVTPLNGVTCGGNWSDFAGFLTSLEENDVLLIEDIHALDKNVAEFLCQPLKDFKMHIVIDKGVNARGVRLNLPNFTLIGTATRKERMPAAFLSSFQIIEGMATYTQEELTVIARRLAEQIGLRVEDGVAEQVASLSCVSPRDVLNRLWHLRNYIHVKPKGRDVTVELASEALSMLARTHAVGEPALEQQRSTKSCLSVDPLKRRYQVFVSSTYEDLKDERRHVMQALLETKCIPTGMELFPAASEEQWKLIKRVIDDCDYYVVVVAGCYGSIGSGGKSYTEMEFDYAVSSGKAVIGFYHSDPGNLIGHKLEKTDERRQKLAAFTKKVKQRMCKPWSTSEGLASAIKSAILHAIEHDRKPGWVRASDLPSKASIAGLKDSIHQKPKRGVSAKRRDSRL